MRNIFALLFIGMFSNSALAAGNSITCDLQNGADLSIVYFTDFNTTDATVLVEGHDDLSTISKAIGKAASLHNGPIAFGVASLSSLIVETKEGRLVLLLSSNNNYQLYNQTTLKGLPMGNTTVTCKEFPLSGPGVSGSN